MIQNVTILNAVQSKITSISALTEYDFEPIENANSSNPTVVYDPHYENVVELEISILKTRDNSIPSTVQLGVYGCADAKSIVTKGVIEPTRKSILSSSNPSF